MICPNCNGTKIFPSGAKTWDCWQCRATGEVDKCAFCAALYVPGFMEHRCFEKVMSETDQPEERFRELCQMHDLTYQYSDDPRWWRRGSFTESKIREYAKAHLTPEAAARIWNE